MAWRSVTVELGSREVLAMLLGSGMVEGMTAALGQTEAILAEP